MDVKSFEEHVVKLYEEGAIAAPVHLSNGNEEQLRDIFKDYREGDWILSTWRSHYHWLMSGRDPKELLRQIVSGHSMNITGDKFFTSSIVGGIAPIAVGLAMAGERVWCFIGDMAATCGIVVESIRYASGHSLPVTFVIEDNGISVTTPTKEVWGTKNKDVVIKYKDETEYPHAGTGKFILF